MRKKTHEEFVREMMEINSNIEILGQYMGADTKILCRCKIDGHQWGGVPSHLLGGQGCPKCAVNAKKKTHKQFIEQMKSVNSNIEILGEYVNARTKILCKCKKDGYEWEVTPNDLLNGKGCPKCAGNNKKTHEEFIEEMREINSDIEILENYVNDGTKILCECKKDGHKWEATPSDLLRGHGCPVCNESKGEKRVRKWLKENELVFDG